MSNSNFRLNSLRIAGAAIILFVPCLRGDADLIRLKSRIIDPSATPSSLREAVTRTRSRNLLVVLEEGKEKSAVNRMRFAGIRVMAWVPDRAVSVHVPAGVDLSKIPGIVWTGSLTSSDKLSEHLQIEPGDIHALVEFHPYLEREKGEALLKEAVKDIQPHPDLPEHMFLVNADRRQLEKLADREEVAFIQPASKPLIEGKRVHYCPGVTTEFGPAAPFVTNGPGWDGSGLGAIHLTYHFLNSTSDLSTSQQRNEIVRALQTWSQYADITWSQTSSPNQSRSLDIGFYNGAHGDGNAFDGPGGVIAHAYFPSPPNGEPIAGDMHFDDGELWRIGANTDLFSVALHEAGHSLGLSHSSDTTAVMYAFYQQVSGLQSDDIAGIRALYSTSGGGGGGGGEDAYEPDNSIPGRPISFGSAQSRSIFPVGDVDWASFNLPSPGGRLVIETSGGSGDTRLYLHKRNNGANSQVAFDDDGGSGLFSRIVYDADPDTYYVKVDDYGNNDTISAYSLTVHFSPSSGGGDANEPNNAPDSATPISPGQTLVNSIRPVGDVDYFRFTLSSLSEVEIETSGSSGDTQLWLFGSDLSVLEFNDDGGSGLFSRIDRTVADNDRLPAGTYYAAVDEYGSDQEIPSYQIRLQVTGSSADDAYEPNNSPSAAFYPGYDWDGIPLSEIHGPAVYRDLDYYRIQVGPLNSRYVEARLFFRHYRGDLDLRLLDSGGRILDSSASVTDNEFIGHEVPRAGTYYLQVSQYGTAPSGQGYDLVWEDLTEEDRKFRTAVNDFDGDGISDLVDWDPRTGYWNLEMSTGGSNRFLTWGDAGMVRADGDYDGDGISDLALYQPATGMWFIRTVADGPPITFGQVWGDASMIPVPGDYNGDGVHDLAVYQRATGNWFIRSLGPTGPDNPPITFGQNWGDASMIPVSGDYNGDGVHDLAVYQASTGNWFIRSLGPLGPENPPITFGQNWGNASMAPVPGDYNGDRRADLAVYQPSSGVWFIRSLGPDGPSNPPIVFGFQWGDPTMWPAPGDYNGDGRADLAVYQTSTANWFIATAQQVLLRFAHRWGTPR